MNRPVRVTPPSATPLALADVKAHLNIDFDADDTLLGALIQAATDHLDGWSGVLGRCLVTQTWRQSFEEFTGRTLRLPFPGAASITSVTYQDADDATQTVAPESYALKEDALGAYLFFAESFTVPETFYRPDAVSVTFTAGYGAADAVPQAIKQAMLLLIGHWYENREAVNIGNIPTEIPMAMNALIAPYRRVSV